MVTEKLNLKETTYQLTMYSSWWKKIFQSTFSRDSNTSPRDSFFYQKRNEFSQIITVNQKAAIQRNVLKQWSNLQIYETKQNLKNNTQKFNTYSPSREKNPHLDIIRINVQIFLYHYSRNSIPIPPQMSLFIQGDYMVHFHEIWLWRKEQAEPAR